MPNNSKIYLKQLKRLSQLVNHATLYYRRRPIFTWTMFVFYLNDNAKPSEYNELLNLMKTIQANTAYQKGSAVLELLNLELKTATNSKMQHHFFLLKTQVQKTVDQHGGDCYYRVLKQQPLHISKRPTKWKDWNQLIKRMLKQFD